MIQHGLRLRDLGTDSLTVHDVVVVCTWGALPGSVLDIARRGPDALWGLNEQLGAAIADAVRGLVWMQSKDGQKGTNRPQPIPRPGVTPESQKTVGTAMTVEEANAWLGWDKKTT